MQSQNITTLAGIEGRLRTAHMRGAANEWNETKRALTDLVRITRAQEQRLLRLEARQQQHAA